MFSLIDEQTVAPQAPDTPPPFDLAFNGLVIGGRLRMSATFRAAVFSAETVDGLLTNFNEALSDVIAHCRSRREATPTPSDFTHSTMTVAELDELVEGLRLDL